MDGMNAIKLRCLDDQLNDSCCVAYAGSFSKKFSLNLARKML